MKIFAKNYEGQSVVTLLIFVIIAISLSAGAIALMITNSRASEKFHTGNEAYYVAESGMENALLRLIRDPSYTGEVLAVGNGTATVSITGTNPVTLLSTGRAGVYVRKIQVIASYTNNVLSVTSWKEVY